jgi:hypothetical protein
MRCKLLVWAAVAVLAGIGAGESRAGGIDVNVGYADGLRGGGFFPNPWQGDAHIVFDGFTDGSDDAGAIRIDNNTGAPLTISNVTVHLHPASQPGNNYALWGTHTLAPGDMLILTETGYYNFDTSDSPISPFGVPVVGGPDSPVVDFTANGNPMSATDTAHVLDTEGYDFALFGANESFQWRPIGTFGGPAGVPEPASLVLFGLGGVALGLCRSRRAK